MNTYERLGIFNTIYSPTSISPPFLPIPALDDDGSGGRWITSNGAHVFLKDGETPFWENHSISKPTPDPSDTDTPHNQAQWALTHAQTSKRYTPAVHALAHAKNNEEIQKGHSQSPTKTGEARKMVEDAAMNLHKNMAAHGKKLYSIAQSGNKDDIRALMEHNNRHLHFLGEHAKDIGPTAQSEIDSLKNRQDKLSGQYVSAGGKGKFSNMGGTAPQPSSMHGVPGDLGNIPAPAMVAPSITHVTPPVSAIAPDFDRLSDTVSHYEKNENGEPFNDQSKAIFNYADINSVDKLHGMSLQKMLDGVTPAKQMALRMDAAKQGDAAHFGSLATAKHYITQNAKQSQLNSIKGLNAVALMHDMTEHGHRYDDDTIKQKISNAVDYSKNYAPPRNPGWTAKAKVTPQVPVMSGTSPIGVKPASQVHSPIAGIPELKDRTKPTVVVMSGVAGSGKSTVKKAMVPKHWEDVGPDDIREKMFPNMDPKNIPQQLITRSAQVASQKVASVRNSGKSLVWDATGLRDDVEDELKAFKKAGYHVHVVNVDVDKPTAKARQLSRARQVPDYKIDQHFSLLPYSRQMLSTYADSQTNVNNNGAKPQLNSHVLGADAINPDALHYAWVDSLMFGVEDPESMARLGEKLQSVTDEQSAMDWVNEYNSVAMLYEN